MKKIIEEKGRNERDEFFVLYFLYLIKRGYMYILNTESEPKRK